MAIRPPYSIELTCPECGNKFCREEKFLANGTQLVECDCVNTLGCGKEFVIDLSCTVMVKIYKISLVAANE